MNKLLVSETKPQNIDKKTYFVQLNQAADILTILRSDHFAQCELNLPQQINNSQLRFLMQVSRVLTKEGEVILRGGKESINKTKTILKNMGLHLAQESQESVRYTKTPVQVKPQEEAKEKKLAIGFKNIENQEIDEDELLKNQKIDLSKPSTGGCGEKVRACANCNCGRKKDESLPSKEELVKSVNEGKPVSGCGKCFLGDSFRCATCPYKGMPAFKPGDKLKLVDDYNVVVETNTTTVVNDGKIKIQI